MPPILGENAILFPSLEGLGVVLTWGSQQRISNTSSYVYTVALNRGTHSEPRGLLILNHGSDPNVVKS